jgi:hypothetical protein
MAVGDDHEAGAVADAVPLLELRKLRLAIRWHEIDHQILQFERGHL